MNLSSIDRRRVAVALTMLVLLASAACTGKPDQASTLADLERPDLSGMDEAIRAALADGRAAFDEALAAGKVTAADYGRIAMLYHANERIAPAETGYRNAMEIEPETFRWAFYLGVLLENGNRSSEAAEVLRRALAIDGNHVPTLIQLGKIHLESNQLDAAGAQFDRALGLDPRCVPAWVGAGNVALARKEYQASVDALLRALEISPESSVAHYPLGLAYRGLGDTERARRYLASRGNVVATTGDPLLQELADLQIGWRVHLDAGNQFVEEDRMEDALNEFEQAAAAAPQQATAHTNVGSALTRLGRSDEAREAFERAIALDPDQTTAQYNLGTIAAQAGDDETAIAYYRNVIARQPDNLNGQFNLGNALRRTQHFDEAAQHYAIVVAEDPANALARLAEALALAAAERYADAIARLEPATAAAPDDHRLRDALARLLAATPVDGVRDGARARGIAESLLAEERSVRHVTTLAMAAAEVGDFATALEWQRGALGAVTRSGRDDLLPEIRENLALYEAGRPCRRPFHPDDPAVYPSRRSSETESG